MTAVSEQSASERSDSWSLSRTATDAIVVALLAVGLQILLTSRFVDVYDEGLTLYGADEILHGRIPYRDFWSLYGPAAFYALAAAFKAFGTSVLVERGVDLAYRAAIVVLVFELARRLTSRQLAFGAALAALAILIAVGSYAAPIFPATAGAFATVLFAERSRRSRRPVVAWFVTGLATGVVASFRTDLGVYAFVVCASGWLMDRMLRASEDERGIRGLVALFAGAIVGAALWTVPLLIAVPLADLWSDFVTIPFTIYAPNRSMPFPRLAPIDEAIGGHIASLVAYLVYVPFLAVAIVVPRLLRGLRSEQSTRGPTRRSTNPSKTDLPLLGMLILLTSLLILKGLVRASVLHMAPALCSAFILLAIVANDYRPGRVRGLFASLAVVVVVIVAVGTPGLKSRLRDIADPALCGSPNIRLRCFRVDDDLLGAVDYVDRHTRPDDAIFEGSTRHDRLLFNKVALYFLADRRAPTKWHDLHPGVQTTLPIQREMIEAFDAQPPALVILDTTYAAVLEPNRSAVSSGVTVLDEWIRRHYARVAELGHFTILKPVP